jgi:hypothetical protein
MTQALEEMALPRISAADTDTAVWLLESMTAEKLPAFVVEEAGLSLWAIANRLRPVFEATGYEILFDAKSADKVRAIEVRKDIYPVGTELSEEELAKTQNVRSDVGPHFDKHPRDTAVIHTLHLTTAGAAQVHLYLPTKEFFVNHRDYCTSDVVNDQYRRQFDAGQVDERLFSPVRYSTTVAAGSLLIFRLGGSTPLVHDFVTTAGPRNAEIGDIVHVHAA